MSRTSKSLQQQKRINIVETASEESTIGETHYLPHHSVIRNDKSTIKCRVIPVYTTQKRQKKKLL